MLKNIMESRPARLIMTVALAGLLWAAWTPAAHLLPRARYRALGVVFVSVAFVWRVWPGFARGYGNFQARLLLTIIYAVLVLPFGILIRLFADPLRIKKPPTHWLDHPIEATDMSWAKRQ